MTWKERLIGVPLALAGAVLLLAGVAGMLATHTAWGRERIRSFALDRLNSAIAGRVEADAIVEGDLLRMVRLAGVRVYGPDGERFASADTVVVHYRWADFLIGSITLPEATLVAPRIHFAQDRQGGWNFLQAFGSADPRPDTTPDDGGRRVVLRDVTIRDGDVTVSTPWDGGTDDSRWHIRGTDGEQRRVLRFEELNASLPRARISGEPGMLYLVSQLSTRATITGRPFFVEQLRADVQVVADTIRFDVWEAELDRSEFFGQGWITAASDPDYDLTLHGSPVEASELRWLIPRLPPGTARLDFRLRTLDGGIAMEADDARWSSSQAELSGRFAMVWGDSPEGLRFEDVDLEIERFEWALIDSITGWTPPIEGTLAGRLALNGEISALAIDSDLRIMPDAGGVSRVIALGGVDARPGNLAAEDLEVRLDSLQIELLRRFVPDLKLRGAITGRGHGHGRLAEGLNLEFELEHHDGALQPIRLSGNGSVALPEGSPLRLDMHVTPRPLSLTTLSEYYPVPFRGDFNGTVQVVGSLADLDIEARLGGPGDSIRVQGNVQLTGAAAPRYEGELRGWRIRLPDFQQGLPRSDLDFRMRFKGEGLDPVTLRADGRIEVFPSFIGGVAVDSATAALRVVDGRLVVDTAVVAAEFGALHAAGGLGLTGERMDSLHFLVLADGLETIAPWIFPSEAGVSTPLVSEDESTEEEMEKSPVLAGSARAIGWLVRDSLGLSVRGRLAATGFVFRDLRADSLDVREMEVNRRGGALYVAGELTASNTRVGDLNFPEVRIDGILVDSLADIRFRVSKEGASASGDVSVAFSDQVVTVGLDTLGVELGGSSWALTEPVQFRFEESGAFDLDRVTLRSGSRLVVLEGEIGTAGPASFGVEVSGVELADVARLWPDTLPVAGTLELKLSLSGRVRSPTVEGSMEVVDGRLFGVSFSSLRGDLSYEGTELAVQSSMWVGDEQLFRVDGTMPFALELPGFHMDVPDRQIDLRIDGDSIPLSLATLLGDAISEPTGHARGSVHVGGSAGDLYLEGPATLIAGGFRVVSTGIRYENLSGGLRFEGAEMRVDTVTFRGSSGGSGRVTGSVDFRKIANPVFDLTIRASRLPVYDQLDARLVVSGQMRVDGPFDGTRVTGNLSVVSGVFFIEEIGRRTEIIDPFEESLLLEDSVLVFDEILAGGRSVFLDNAVIDVAVSMQRDTWLRSDNLNVEIAGDLRLNMHRAQNQLRIDGTLRAVRGEYRFLSKRFEVVEGTIEFVGTPAMNPNLNIIAAYTVRTQKEPIRIELVLGGTLEDPTLNLRSDAQPPIPESDLISYLIFGRPTYEFTRASENGSVFADVTGDLLAGVPRTVFSYALESLLVGETGIAYVDVSEATGPGTTDGEYEGGVAPALTATQVEVGWYLAPTVFVSVAQQVANSFQPTVKVEWRLNEHLTLRGVSEPRFGQRGSFFREATDAEEQSFGVFLFYGWTY